MAPPVRCNRVHPSIVNVWKSLAAGLCLLLLTVTTGMLCSRRPDARSVGPVKLAGMLGPPTFSRAESMGLFVGVRTFPHDSSLEVPYAVDDAVDLAYRFALDQRVGLIPPRQVVLVISGTPQKEESKQRLKELKNAGAKINYGATTGDIFQLLEEQAARAARGGMLVLSIATHGFQQKGEAYILGSASEFDEPETALRIATLLDIAARVPRSLIFIDACRQRVDSRGTPSDATRSAPHFRRMAPVRGQVIFYAAAPGQYAFDDDVHRNGVFTKAVLDGLDCEASAPRGMVIAETLHTYVDREVRRWIREKHKVTINPATQVSMEGETRNMPLAQCWRSPGPRVRASIDGSIVTAYDADTNPMWRKDFGESVIHAEAADLDADALYEVIVGLRNRIVVLDRDGKELWNKLDDTRTLRTFTTGDLFEKHTNQIVALWIDDRASTSRLTVTMDDGAERPSFDFGGELHHVVIGRPTNMHAPKIAAATATHLVLLHPKKLDRGVPLWELSLSSPGDTIDELRIADANHDSRREIGIVARSGATTWFTFDGKIVRQNAGTARHEATVRR